MYARQKEGTRSQWPTTHAMLDVYTGPDLGKPAPPTAELASRLSSSPLHHTSDSTKTVGV